MKLDIKGAFQFGKEIINLFGLIMVWSLIIIMLFGGKLHVEMNEGIIMKFVNWVMGLF